MKQSHISSCIVFLLASVGGYSAKAQSVLKGKIFDTQYTSLPGVSVKWRVQLEPPPMGVT